MELAVALVLLLGGIIGVAVLVVAIPAVFGLMAYDLIDARRHETAKASAKATHSESSIAIKRGVARAFVILGSLFWSFATFADLYSLQNTGAGEAALAAIIPLAGCLVTLVVGWYWERFTAALLLLASIGVLAWGIVYQFTPQVWAVMTIALIGPMLTASVLFWLARREQEAFEATFSLRPQLAFAFAARSTLQ